MVDVGGVVQACRELTAEITDRPELAHTSHLLVRIGDRTVFDAHLIVTTGDPRFDPGPPPRHELHPAWRPARDLVVERLRPLLA